MLSLLTTATPPKATTGAAPGAALPGGRADESPDASGGFARALQDSSAALQPPDARAGQTGTDTDAQARGGRGARADRPRALGLAGGMPPGLDPSTHGGRSAARTGRGPAGSQDDPATGDPAAAAAAAVASLLPAADPAASAAASAASPAPAIASGDLPPHAAAAAHAAGADQRDATHGGDPVARRLTGGPAEAGPAFAAPPISRPGPAVATPESTAQTGTTEAQQASDVADTLAGKLAGDAAADASASAGTPPANGPTSADGAAAGLQAATATPPAPSAIPLSAALNTTAASVPAAADRADAARRAIAATPRAATASDARAATGEARRASGRADSTDTPGTTAAPAVMAGAAPTVRPAAADPGRAAASDAALDRSATEPGGTAANGSSAATGTAPATTPLPRFAEQFQAALAAAPTTAPRTAEAPEAARAQLGPPLASPEFPPALGAQVSLFARSGVERATIEISPPEMGPISVQIALDGSAARVDFLADAAATRQVIEASLPTLASALREAGLTLSGGGVFQQPQSSAGSGGQGGSGQPGHGHAGRPATADDGQGGAGPATVLRTTAQRGLVDLVA
jgi:flagellar hook-length control protein FliK